MEYSDDDFDSSREETKLLFDRASDYMRNNRSLKLSTEQKLKLYGLFKQVSTSKRCNRRAGNSEFMLGKKS